MIVAACDFVSVLTVSVCVSVALTAAADRFSVTPLSTPDTVLLALVDAMPLSVNFASCATALCRHAAALFADSIFDAPPVVSAVDVTPRFDSPLSLATLPTATLIAFAEPVFVDASTRCAPSVPLITVALIPGLFAAELIAAAMPDSVLFVPVTSTLNDWLPSDSVSVPVPSALLPSKPAEASACAVAVCVTPIV
ncbi:Uncharacterised protein [Burkholderia cepacia]|uniref:Secreted protein n=1 Tax=Burkholderia cepacia TaxID=292 RepID=A0AAE8NFP8_BURCE|nr:Uncharacterised protein [Burkholderia cepacia]